MMPLFFLFALLVILGGLVTILAPNAVHAALGLVATLLSLAVVYVMLSANFLAAVQVIVYAGAIMVLFLFVIMLLDATQPVKTENPVPYIGEMAGIGAALLSGVMVLLVNTFKAPMDLAQATAKLQNGAPGVIGETLFTRFLLPFEAVSVVLLVAIIGAVVLVRRPEIRGGQVYAKPLTDSEGETP